MFSLGGLGWRLPGLSELPPEHRLLVLLAGPFQLLFALYTFFVLLVFSQFHFFSLLQLFLRFSTLSFKLDLCEFVFQVFNILVVVEYLCSSSTASTSKHSAITLAQSSKPSTCRSEYIQVSKEALVCIIRICNMHAASGLFSWRWSFWHFQVACLHLKCWSI